jgi:hypothetical protein
MIFLSIYVYRFCLLTAYADSLIKSTRFFLNFGILTMIFLMMRKESGFNIVELAVGLVPGTDHKPAHFWHSWWKR